MSDAIKVAGPDGSPQEFPRGVKVAEVVRALYPDRAEVTVAALVDGKEADLQVALQADVSAFRPITVDTPEGLEVLRHSTSHLMANAVKSLFPQAKVTIGPAIDTGFYYDFDVPGTFSPEDLARIEARMAEVGQADLPFIRMEWPKAQAIAFFREQGEHYKVEIIEGIEDPIVSIYRVGDFVDLCTGPHVPSTSRIRAFKLLSTAGAYWRGDERNPMLQRIYGTSFPDRASLEAHLRRLEEARERDHRKLGRELDLFSVQEDAGGGLIFWHPKGTRVRMVIEELLRRELLRAGYQFVTTPHLVRRDLLGISGHLDFYSEYMYAPMDVEGQQYIVKPMNCPGHILIYRSALRSYRELPIRLAELGTVYRFERSGVLHGLLRVRGFTQDDAHIFCRPEQLLGEITQILQMMFAVLRLFGFDRYEVYLSTRPEKFVGVRESWDQAEAALADALKALGCTYEVDAGGGAFYGPKVDLKIMDVLDRAWQCGTVQVDFNFPERFDLAYISESGARARPIMVHRAILGSLERFMGVLIEHYRGAFPTWLAPVQAVVLNVTQAQEPYGEQVYQRLLREGVRVERDFRNETLGHKIRDAQLKKVPYMLVIGKREAEAGGVSPRTRAGQDLKCMPLEQFLDRLREECRPCTEGLLG
ncbi:MAG: threonine--tRNA ligase [Deltaproteobacteria bacterium]|nr:threonine--tRNA ligase [Deltaproteobacteria bacterium]